MHASEPEHWSKFKRIWPCLAPNFSALNAKMSKCLSYPNLHQFGWNSKWRLIFIQVTPLIFLPCKVEAFFFFFSLWPSFSFFLLKSGSQSCCLSLQRDYSRILTPKFLLGWQTSTKTPRDTKERWAVNWSLIVLAHYGVPQWGRSYFVASQGQYLKARAMEGISREIFNLRKRKGAFLVKDSLWILMDCGDCTDKMLSWQMFSPFSFKAKWKAIYPQAPRHFLICHAQ